MSDQLSDSSLSRMSPVPSNDLSVKYQKIASEYSKIRAQATVLKKAVLEEQAKNADLQEILRERDQNLRKTDQEMESLTFRNQQLTKRVEFLQEELDQCQKGFKKNSSKSKSSNPPRSGPEHSNHVLDMEFKKMVEENAQLLSKIYESEEEHKQEINALNEQIDRFQKELSQHGKQTSVAEETLKAAVQKVNCEKSELYETIKLQEQHLKSLTEELVNLNKYKLESIPQLEAALLIIATYLPFIDTSDPKLNLRSKGNEEQNTYQKVKKEMENLMLYFSLFFSSLKKRLLLIHSNLINSFDELSIDLSAKNDFVFDKSSELSSLLLPLFLKFKKLAKLLLPLFVQSLLQEEKENWGCCQANQELSKSLNEFLQLFIKMSFFVESSMTNSEIQETNDVNQTLLKLLHSLLDSVSAIKTAYVTKEQAEKRIALDSKLSPKLLNVESELQTVNISCVHLLTNLTLSLQMLINLLQELNLVNNSENMLVTGIQNGASKIEMKANMKSYVESLKSVIDAEEGDVWKRLLLEQLDSAQKKIIDLEKERIHLLNEYQLMKLKSNEFVESNAVENLESKVCVDSNLIGSLKSPFSMSQEIEAREERIKNYFTNQLNLIVIKNQEALSKADTFSIECGVLQRRLELSSEARRESERKLIESSEKIMELYEKLQLTKQNYEIQLSTMSDHLANVGDKLTQQTDQLEQLKSQLNHARKKK